MVGFFGQLVLGPVVSIGHSCAFYVVLVPPEYIPSVPPHFTYVIVFLSNMYQNKSYRIRLNLNIKISYLFSENRPFRDTNC